MEKILQIFRIGSVNLATSDVVGVCLGCELDTMWRDLANVWFSGALGLRKIDAFCSAFFYCPCRLRPAHQKGIFNFCWTNVC